MAKRIVRRGSQQLRDELALLEVLEPIEDAHLDAKEAYRAAVTSGDPAAIREARQHKAETGNHLEATRTWLRVEAAIVKLSTRLIPELERILAGPILVKHGADDAREDQEERARLEAKLAAYRRELELFIAEAVPVRQQLQALGGQVVGGPVPPGLPPGSADVTTPTIAVTTTVNRRPKGAN